MEEYLLVNLDTHASDCYRNGSDGMWLLHPFGRGDAAALASFGLTVTAAHGYRSGNRFIVFQLLQHVLGLGPKIWRVRSKCHDIRNQGEYEGNLHVDERIVAELIAACQKINEELGTLPPIQPA